MNLVHRNMLRKRYGHTSRQGVRKMQGKRRNGLVRKKAARGSGVQRRLAALPGTRQKTPQRPKRYGAESTIRGRIEQAQIPKSLLNLECQLPIRADQRERNGSGTGGYLLKFQASPLGQLA